MPATYEPIATTTLGSATSTITFSSISSAYTDLRLIFVGTGTGSSPRLRFNGDTATNYSGTRLYGDGATANTNLSASVAQIAAIYNTAMSTTIPEMFTADLMSYAGSTYKTCLITACEDLNGSGSVERTVGMWRSTSAINSISIFLVAQNFSIGTTATLYGILKA